jgi:hypothetical protein
MDVLQIAETGSEHRESGSAPLVYPKFNKNDEFHRTLRKRLDQYVAESGRNPRDTPAMYAKSAIVFGAFVTVLWSNYLQ